MTFKVLTLSFSNMSSLNIKKGDITQWFFDGSSDAIVNATNEMMLFGGVTAPYMRQQDRNFKRLGNVPEAQPGVRCPT